MAGRDAERKAKCDECGEIHSGIDCVQLVFILVFILRYILYTITTLLP